VTEPGRHLSVMSPRTRHPVNQNSTARRRMNAMVGTSEENGPTVAKFGE